MAKNPAFNFHILASPDNYMHTVEAVSFLVFSEIKNAEDSLDALKPGEHPTMALLMLPRLVSMVNMMGYFRGQDGSFLNVRPMVAPEDQHEIYRSERKYEDMLAGIINRLFAAGYGDECRERLEQYYVRHCMPPSTEQAVALSQRETPDIKDH